MTTKDQERQAIEKIRKIVEGLGENSYVGFAMDGILELAEDNIREDTAYSMKERAEIAQKDARKAEKENKDLKAEIEDLKKTVEKRGATISELNTELCNARAEAKANEIPEEAFCVFIRHDILSALLPPHIFVPCVSVVPSALIADEARFFCFSGTVVYRFHVVCTMVAEASSARKSAITSSHAVLYLAFSSSRLLAQLSSSSIALL